MKKIVINCETNEIIEVELTEKEISQSEIDIRANEEKEKANSLARLAKIELFKKLGITEEEAKLLLS